MNKNCMKICYVFTWMVLVGLPFCGYSQCTIRGKVSGMDGKWVYLNLGGAYSDSVQISGGEFLFKTGELDGPRYALFTTKEYGFGQYWITNGEDIILTVEEGSQIRVSGAKVEEEYQLYRKHMAGIWQRQSEMLKQANAAADAGNMDEYSRLRHEFEKLKPEEDEVFIEFAKRNPASYICLNYIYNCRVIEKYEFSRYSAMFGYLTPGAFQGKQWETFREIYERDKALQPGEVFPDFTLADVFETPVKLSQLRGKYILLTIGSGGLDDYMALLPLKKDLYDRFGTRNLEIVDILVAGEKNDLLKVTANYDVAWLLLSDYQAWYSPLLRDWGIDKICQLFLLDPQGEIVARNVWGNELKRLVESECQK